MLIDINSFRSPLYTLEYKRQNVVKPGHLFGGGVAVVIVLLFFKTAFSSVFGVFSFVCFLRRRSLVCLEYLVLFVFQDGVH